MQDPFLNSPISSQFQQSVPVVQQDNMQVQVSNDFDPLNLSKTLAYGRPIPYVGAENVDEQNAAFKDKIKQIRSMAIDSNQKKEMIEASIRDYATALEGTKIRSAGNQVDSWVKSLATGAWDSVVGTALVVPDILGKVLATVGLGSNLYNPGEALRQAQQEAFELDKNRVREIMKERGTYSWFSDKGANIVGSIVPDLLMTVLATVATSGVATAPVASAAAAKYGLVGSKVAKGAKALMTTKNMTKALIAKNTMMSMSQGQGGFTGSDLLKGAGTFAATYTGMRSPIFTSNMNHFKAWAIDNAISFVGDTFQNVIDPDIKTGQQWMDNYVAGFIGNNMFWTKGRIFDGHIKSSMQIQNILGQDFSKADNTIKRKYTILGQDGKPVEVEMTAAEKMKKDTVAEFMDIMLNNDITPASKEEAFRKINNHLVKFDGTENVMAAMTHSMAALRHSTDGIKNSMSDMNAFKRLYLQLTKDLTENPVKPEIMASTYLKSLVDKMDSGALSEIEKAVLYRSFVKNNEAMKGPFDNVDGDGLVAQALRLTPESVEYINSKSDVALQALLMRSYTEQKSNPEHATRYADENGASRIGLDTPEGRYAEILRAMQSADNPNVRTATGEGVVASRKHEEYTPPTQKQGSKVVDEPDEIKNIVRNAIDGLLPSETDKTMASDAEFMTKLDLGNARVVIHKSEAAANQHRPKKGVDAWYDASTHTLHFVNKKTGLDNTNVLHEFAHAVTHGKYESDPKFRGEIDKIASEIKDVLGLDIAPKELLAEAFSNKSFRESLRNAYAPDKQTFFGKLVGAIGRLFSRITGVPVKKSFLERIVSETHESVKDVVEPVLKPEKLLKDNTNDNKPDLDYITAKKNVFKITASNQIDKKAEVKGSIATKFIGFGFSDKKSETHGYSVQAGKHANTGSYNAKDVVFVSVPGKRHDKTERTILQDKTIAEAIKAINANAVLITDNSSHLAKNDYNEGELMLAKKLREMGHKYFEIEVDGTVLGTWTMGTKKRPPVARNSSYATRAKEIDLGATNKSIDNFFIIGEKTDGITDRSLAEMSKAATIGGLPISSFYGSENTKAIPSIISDFLGKQVLASDTVTKELNGFKIQRSVGFTRISQDTKTFLQHSMVDELVTKKINGQERKVKQFPIEYEELAMKFAIERAVASRLISKLFPDAKGKEKISKVHKAMGLIHGFSGYKDKFGNIIKKPFDMTTIMTKEGLADFVKSIERMTEEPVFDRKYIDKFWISTSQMETLHNYLKDNRFGGVASDKLLSLTRASASKMITQIRANDPYFSLVDKILPMLDFQTEHQADHAHRVLEGIGMVEAVLKTNMPLLSSFGDGRLKGTEVYKMFDSIKHLFGDENIIKIDRDTDVEEAVGYVLDHYSAFDGRFVFLTNDGDVKPDDYKSIASSYNFRKYREIRALVYRRLWLHGNENSYQSLLDGSVEYAHGVNVDTMLFSDTLGGGLSKPSFGQHEKFFIIGQVSDPKLRSSIFRASNAAVFDPKTSQFYTVEFSDSRKIAAYSEAEFETYGSKSFPYVRALTQANSMRTPEDIYNEMSFGKQSKEMVEDYIRDVYMSTSVVRSFAKEHKWFLYNDKTSDSEKEDAIKKGLRAMHEDKAYKYVLEESLKFPESFEEDAKTYYLSKSMEDSYETVLMPHASAKIEDIKGTILLTGNMTYEQQQNAFNFLSRNVATASSDSAPRDSHKALFNKEVVVKNEIKDQYVDEPEVSVNSAAYPHVYEKLKNGDYVAIETVHGKTIDILFDRISEKLADKTTGMQDLLKELSNKEHDAFIKKTISAIIAEFDESVIAPELKAQAMRSFDEVSKRFADKLAAANPTPRFPADSREVDIAEQAFKEKFHDIDFGLIQYNIAEFDKDAKLRGTDGQRFLIVLENDNGEHNAYPLDLKQYSELAKARDHEELASILQNGIISSKKNPKVFDDMELESLRIISGGFGTKQSDEEVDYKDEDTGEYKANVKEETGEDRTNYFEENVYETIAIKHSSIEKDLGMMRIEKAHKRILDAQKHNNVEEQKFALRDASYDIATDISVSPDVRMRAIAFLDVLSRGDSDYDLFIKNNIEVVVDALRMEMPTAKDTRQTSAFLAGQKLSETIAPRNDLKISLEKISQELGKQFDTGVIKEHRDALVQSLKDIKDERIKELIEDVSDKIDALASVEAKGGLDKVKDALIAKIETSIEQIGKIMNTPLYQKRVENQDVLQKHAMTYIKNGKISKDTQAQFERTLRMIVSRIGTGHDYSTRLNNALARMENLSSLSDIDARFNNVIDRLDIIDKLSTIKDVDTSDSIKLIERKINAELKALSKIIKGNGYIVNSSNGKSNNAYVVKNDDFDGC